MTKLCSKCKELKSVSEFNKARCQSDGLFPHCRNCQAIVRKQYYAEHREDELKQISAYYMANSERLRQRRKQRYIEGNEKLIRRKEYWANPEKFRKLANAFGAKHKPWRRYRAENPDKAKELVRRYQSRKFGTAVEKVSYEAIRVRDKDICHICKQTVIGKIHFDHVIPLSRGGTHTFGNIAVSHPFCNLSKAAKLMEEVA